MRARCLALTQRRQQVEVGTLVAKSGLSVRDTEGMVRGILARASGGARRRKQGLDPNVQRLQDELTEKLGAHRADPAHGFGQGQSRRELPLVR